MGSLPEVNRELCDMFSDSEEDNSDYGANRSPDSTREIFRKRKRLNSDDEFQHRSRSSTPAFSSQVNSPFREGSSARNSENEDAQITSNQYQRFYRSRSSSGSQSRSKSVSRSRSRSISRSMSRSRSNSSRSFVNSR